MSTSKARTPLESMLDLAVYAPLGLIVSVTEELPALVEKGRQRATLAKMMGEFAAPQIQTEAAKILRGVLDRIMPPGPPAAPPRPDRRESAVRPTSNNGAAGPRGAARANGSRPAVVSNPVDPAASAALAIPGYDSLSAMQVVQRLPGLSPDELDAVRAYEAAHRGRKTILNRADQLLSGSST